MVDRQEGMEQTVVVLLEKTGRDRLFAWGYFVEAQSAVREPFVWQFVGQVAMGMFAEVGPSVER